MLCIIITLSLLSVLCVDSIEPEIKSTPPKAVSTQSHRRGDVPLSYSITLYHDYTTNRPTEEVKNHVIQYAPLVPVKSVLNPTPTTPSPHQLTFRDQLKLKSFHPNEATQNTLETAEKKIHHQYLDPRIKSNKNSLFPYSSFVHEHNVVVSPKFRHKASISEDIYKSYLEPVPSKKITVPKILLKEKHPESVTQEVLLEPETPHIQNSGFAVRKIVANSLSGQDDTKIERPHHEDLFPQLPPPRAPRLHLNIARVYGIAHIPQQGYDSPLKMDTIPSHTQAIIKPQAELESQDITLLYPLKNFDRRRRGR